MKNPRRIVFVAGLLVVLGVAIVFALGILQDHRQRGQAEQLLKVLQQIRVGSTDRATVVQMTSPFRRYQDVSSGGDQLNFVFFNDWLHRLRLAPHVEFRVTINFNGAVVVDKRARQVVSTTGCAAEVVESERGFKVPSGFPIPPNHKLVAWPDASRQHVWRIRIEDDNTYGETQRRDDWRFDLSCMTKIGPGCRDARVMLPNAVLSP
jgi:hypothetical protein